MVYTSFVKPCFDRVGAFLLLLAAMPVFVLVLLALAIANKGKIWFIQTRPGFREQPFHLIKFKTMSDQVDTSGNLLPDEKRLTRIGKILRKTSLDELPQLLNVLKGEMSFVGPRPLLMEYLPLYSKEHRQRHLVKPGITGWAQVKGRNAISWEERFTFDIWYVRNISFLLDLKILFLTIVKVFKAEGVNAAAGVTMEKFRGNEQSDKFANEFRSSDE